MVPFIFPFQFRAHNPFFKINLFWSLVNIPHQYPERASLLGSIFFQVACIGLFLSSIF